MGIYLWLIHVDVWQKPTQYGKAIIFQLKINKLKKTSHFQRRLRELRSHVPHNVTKTFFKKLKIKKKNLCGNRIVKGAPTEGSFTLNSMGEKGITGGGDFLLKMSLFGQSLEKHSVPETHVQAQSGRYFFLISIHRSLPAVLLLLLLSRFSRVQLCATP